jgi:hypothetical protein
LFRRSYQLTDAPLQMTLSTAHPERSSAISKDSDLLKDLHALSDPKLKTLR